MTREKPAVVTRHDLPTIAAMAVVASGLAALFHEGLGHGVTAWRSASLRSQRPRG